MSMMTRYFHKVEVGEACMSKRGRKSTKPRLGGGFLFLSLFGRNCAIFSKRLSAHDLYLLGHYKNFYHAILPSSYLSSFGPMVRLGCGPSAPQCLLRGFGSLSVSSCPKHDCFVHVRLWASLFFWGEGGWGDNWWFHSFDKSTKFTSCTKKVPRGCKVGKGSTSQSLLNLTVTPANLILSYVRKF